MKKLDLVLGFDSKFMTGFFEMSRTDDLFFKGCSYDVNYFRFVTTHSYFLSRSLAERTVAFKQYVPYLVLRYKDLFAVHTVEKLESRNFDKVSLGISCHVTDFDKNPCGGDMYAYITNAVYRRFSEEFVIQDSVPFDDLLVKSNFRQPRCFMYSDFNSSGFLEGSNHFGIVYQIKISEDIKDRIDFSSDKKKLEWVSRGDLRESTDTLTDWSNLYLETP